MADDDAPPVNNRSKTGKFVPGGRSPNPAGRRKGARNRRTILADKLLASVDVAGILARMEKAALKGDHAAAKLILDRTIPVRRGMPIAIKLPAIRTAADCVAAMSVVMAALAKGSLSSIEAADLGGLIDTAGRSIERTELDTRIASIEASLRRERGDDH